MKQVLQYPKRGELRVEELPAPALKVGGVVIANRASLISAGTERAIIEMAEKSLVGKARQRPDLVRQVIEKAKTEGLLNTYRKVRGRLGEPSALGYSCAGVISEVSPEITDLTVGQRVAAAGFGYASHAEMVFVPKNLTVPIPDAVSMEEASFVTLGAIALQGVRQANPVLGETVAVIGLGLIGQLTLQMLRANGCAVIGMDIDESKISLARSLGTELALNNESAEAISQCMRFTGGAGADRVIVTAASSSPKLMKLAADICRDRGQITVVGAVSMDLDRRPFYNKELTLNLSRSYGPGRYDTKYEEQGHDYPQGYVRWTERRNMKLFLDMIADGKVTVRELITHRFPLEAAADGFDLVMGRSSGKFLGVVVNYDHADRESAAARSVRIESGAGSGMRTIPRPMVLGAIGAGGFSTGVLYPILKNLKQVSLKRIVTTNGMRATQAARRFGFSIAGTSIDEALNDLEITAALIATPHNFHAAQTVAALRANKDVFVEKPLATSPEELNEVIRAYRESSGKLMVGLNRRFSPSARTVREKLAALTPPALYTYRINAGFVPKDNPLQDDTIGRGRIIGEVCHFIDTILYLSGAAPVSVFVSGAGFEEGAYLSSDNIQVNLSLSDGSIAVITYIACGGAGLAKELVEAHCRGVSFVIDDFKVVRMYGGGKATTLASGTQDKGHRRELEMFATLARDDVQMTRILSDAVMATRTTFAIVESLRTGSVVPIAPE
ncbi:MAG: bi-domain-containing oxidoreductase [Candidatus Zixiibacteriota bacterium]